MSGAESRGAPCIGCSLAANMSSAPAPPVVYLFYGDEELAIEESLAQLRAQLGDPTTADLNTNRFSGGAPDLGALEEACFSTPFLAARRLVILDDAERLPRKAEFATAFTALLDRLPTTTALVLIEHVSFRKNADQEAWQRRSFTFRWIEEHPEAGYARAFLRPRGPAFAAWLRSRAESHGGDLVPDAAQLLAEWVDEDPILADQELRKLLEYVDYQRPIESEDVERLTPYRGQGDVFAMVDAVGERDSHKAIALLHELLEQEDPRYAFAMILRQFRLLIQARELLESGQDVNRIPGVHPYVAGKIGAQARNFNLDQLERMYHELLDLDIASKTGRSDLPAGLDLFIFRLSAIPGT